MGLDERISHAWLGVREPAGERRVAQEHPAERPHGERQSRAGEDPAPGELGVEPVSRPEPIAVGGRQGRGMFLRSPSPFPDAQGQPQVERDWLVTVSQSDGSMIFMIFVAPEPDFNHLKPTFEAMVKSVQFR
jgi:hypothetical protein